MSDAEYVDESTMCIQLYVTREYIEDADEDAQLMLGAEALAAARRLLKETE